MPPMTPQTFVSLAFAARHANIPTSHLVRLIDQGVITVRKLPGSPRRVLLDDVVRVVAESTVTMGGPAGGQS